MKQLNIPKEVITAQYLLLLIFFIQIRTEFGQPGSYLRLIILSLIALAVLAAVAGLYYRSRIAGWLHPPFSFMLP